MAHGYLTLSLLPRLSLELFTFEGLGRAVNYGLDKVRFLSFVRPGDRIRARRPQCGLQLSDESGAVCQLEIDGAE